MSLRLVLTLFGRTPLRASFLLFSPLSPWPLPPTCLSEAFERRWAGQRWAVRIQQKLGLCSSPHSSLGSTGEARCGGGAGLLRSELCSPCWTNRADTLAWVTCPQTWHSCGGGLGSHTAQVPEARPFRHQARGREAKLPGCTHFLNQLLWTI